MDLVEVEVVDSQPLKGGPQLLCRLLAGPPPRLAGQEELVPVIFHPLVKPQLGVAVGRGDVDVVHPVLDGDLHERVGLSLGDPSEGGAAQGQDCAHVASAAKSPPLHEFHIIHRRGRIKKRLAPPPVLVQRS